MRKSPSTTSHPRRQPRGNRRRQRGSVYILVMGVSMIVVTLGIGGILAARLQSKASGAGSDSSEARFAALSGVEIARLWVSLTPTWRTDFSNGNVWTTGVGAGGGTITITAVDPIDANLANRPYDPLTITSTGQKGSARQIVTQTLVASPTPLPLLQYAVHSAKQLRVSSGNRIIAGSASVSTNLDFKGDSGSTLEGSVVAQSSSSSGIVFGSITTGAASRTLPDPGVVNSYASLGTDVSVLNLIDKQAIGPGRNPWGAANADGVYVVRTGSDLTIRNTRIFGTLVVICPGRTVTFDQRVFIQPARTDYPALIVNGKIRFQLAAATTLSESSQNTNYNPSGVPYNGTSDSDTADVYPNEIQGLVHATDDVTVNGATTIRGALICEGALQVSADALQVIYTPSLYTSPPQFYTTSVKMIPLAGNLKQLVN